MAERPKVVPLNEIKDLDINLLGWKPVYFKDDGGNVDTNHVIGLSNPKVGSFILHAMIDKDGNYQYDFPLHEDGRLNEKGEATPGAVVVPVRLDEEGNRFVRSIIEYRAAITDPTTGTRGVEINGVPGGFAKKVGTDTQKTASQQALSEAGVKLTKYQGPFYASPNRAYGSTPIGYYIAEYVSTQDNEPEKYESIMGSQEILLEEFPLGLDGIANTAIAFAWQELGYIRKP